MKRFLPFLIIIAVALITAGTATWLYRVKMQPPAPVPATAAASATATTAITATTAAPAAEASPAAQGTDPESLHVRGQANAPATLEIYGDFQCPSCAKTTEVIDELAKNYGPRLRIIFHEFPLEMHKYSVPAAMAAEAAGLQGHFWEMHDMLYKYQDVWSRFSEPERLFSGYAQSLGLDVARFDADAKSDQLRGFIQAKSAEGVARGVKNTPTIFVNGNRVMGTFVMETLQEAIDAAIAGKNKS